MKLTMDVAGLPELEKALKDLRAEMSGKEGNIMSNSIRAAAKDTVLFSQQAAATRHQKTGVLVQSLKLMRHPRPQYLDELYGVGVHKMGKRPRKGESQNTGLPWYAKLVEYGGRGKTGPLKGFIRQSLENNREQYLRRFVREAGVRIERAAKKIGNDNLRRVGAKLKT